MSNESGDPERSTRAVNLRFKEVHMSDGSAPVGVIENPEVRSEWIESTVYYPILD